MAFEKGDTVRAEVLDVKDNGIYLRYDGVDGFINATQITWKQGRVDPRACAKSGDRIDVRVYAVTADRFYGSIKELYPEDNPWKDPDLYLPASRHHGFVCGLTSFGAFIELDRGAVGYMPLQEAHGLTAGERVDVTVVSVDPRMRKIELKRAADRT